MLRLPLTLALVTLPLMATAQDSETPTPDTPIEAPMSLDRLDTILKSLDENIRTDGRVWQLTIADTPVLIITDPDNDRMRALSPVADLEDVQVDTLRRMMQANYDTALDARYAIAKDMVWSTYIHPLSPLEKDQLISGLGQVVNLVQTYGTLYTGGAMQFGGGDSGTLQRDLIDELLKKGEEL
ncbi:hypothetical protein FIU89_08645 [Roseovarius sp. THAF27]|uniref:type III secretion system chaperone n=1 Tax=Roseovarius sp. THAF27 TaxID=2587850 RepID=UPI0012680733|nr:type III secretion system chaperone [Roseovarius sp. THAF27]QFT80675.1 hypothetical protein FIU89_08645 [Roseovarius sp. THAF27]